VVVVVVLWMEMRGISGHVPFLQPFLVPSGCECWTSCGFGESEKSQCRTCCLEMGVEKVCGFLGSAALEERRVGKQRRWGYPD
jgi:hypothetical protein